MNNFRLWIRLGAVALCPTALFSQSPEIQALIQEVRALRTELDRATRVAVQAQVLVFRIGWQHHALSEAQRRHDGAKLGLDQFEERLEWGRREIQQVEKELRESSNPNARQRFADRILQLKTALENQPVEEGKLQAAEVESLQKLRLEEGKLAELNEQLERLERGVAHPPRS